MDGPHLAKTSISQKITDLTIPFTKRNPSKIKCKTSSISQIIYIRDKLNRFSNGKNNIGLRRLD